MTQIFRPREFHRPKDLDEAIGLLARFGRRAKVIAGGTELLVHKPMGVDCLIDIAGLNLSYIKKGTKGIHIGASTILDIIESSPIITSEPYRVLSEAVSMLATPTIRNMATIGGNICSASPAGDLPPVLMVLDATVNIAGSKGSRVLAIGEFFRDVKKTVLGEDELLVEIHIPQSAQSSGAGFQKLRHHQTSIDIAIVNAATRLTCSGNRCEHARIAIGAVANTPIYSRKAEKLLIGKKIDKELIQGAAEAAAEESKPIDDIRATAWYRKRMVAVLVRRALEDSARRCGAWQN